LEGQSTALAGRLVILDGDMQTGYPLATTVAALVSAKSEFQAAGDRLVQARSEQLQRMADSDRELLSRIDALRSEVSNTRRGDAGGTGVVESE